MGKAFTAKVGASTSHKGIYILIMGRLRTAVGENVCYLTKCGGATMLLTYARRCICDARYSGQNLKRVGILRQRGNILPLSIQRGNLQPYIFRGATYHVLYIDGWYLTPPTFAYIRAENWERIFKKTFKTMLYPHKCTTHKAQKGKGGAVSLFIAKHIRVSSRRDCYLFLNSPQTA